MSNRVFIVVKSTIDDESREGVTKEIIATFNSETLANKFVLEQEKLTENQWSDFTIVKQAVCVRFFKVTDIEWDTTDENCEEDLNDGNLPKEVLISTPYADDDTDWDDVLASALSDTYGYCVNSFKYESFNN